MKKAILGLSVLVVLTSVIIFAVNAQNGNQEDKSKILPGVRCYASMTKSCNPTDTKITETSTLKCNPGECKGGKCDPATCKIGKCDPGTCKGNNCDPAKCKTNCGGDPIAMKCERLNCNR